MDKQSGDNAHVRQAPLCRGHVFISYVREDSAEVDELQYALEAAGVPVWRDTASLWPGEDWRVRIREAITQDALAFIACFSSSSAARQKTHLYEELLLAAEQLRLRQPNDPWLIPVRFDNCDIPCLDLGLGRTLSSLHRADLFGANRDEATERLVAAVQWRLRRPGPSAAEPPDPVPAEAKAASGPEPGNRRKAAIALGFLAAVVTVIAVADAPGTSSTAIRNAGDYLQAGPHYFINDQSRYCLNQDYTGRIMHKNILAYPCQSTANEVWSVRVGSGSTYTLTNSLSHLGAALLR